MKNIDKALNAATLYAFFMLLKLVYFSSQIGTGSTWLLNVLMLLGSVMLLLSPGFLLKPAASKWYMITLNSILSFVILSDVIFYRYFNDLISIPLLLQASNVSDIGSSMLKLIHISDLLLAADFILLPITRIVLANKPCLKQAAGRSLQGALACFFIGSIIVMLGFHQLLASQPAILKTFYDRVYVAQSIGLLNYHAADIYTFAQQSINEESEMDEPKKQEIVEFFRLSKQSMNDCKLLHGTAQGKNLIVIQMEALQQFVINRSINGQEITPNLNKLAASGIYFDNYYFQTAGGGTSDAEFTANVSMFPMKEGAVYIRKPGNFYYSLPLKLKESGFSTVAMHGYKPGFWNRSVVYKNIGFDQFYSKGNLEENELLGMGISDKDFFAQAAKKLKMQKQPYYAFLITLSSHFPYDNDKSKYSSFDVGEYKDTLLGDYLEAVHYTDEAIGQFVDEMKKSGALKDTVLVLYGDHHGIPKDNEKELAKFLGWEQLSSMEWQQLQKVPLIINIPGIDPMTISTAGGGVDLMPTLLNLMGMEDSGMPSFGQDLINGEENMVVLRNGSFVTDDLIYISSENICYDINTGSSIPEDQYREIKQQADKKLSYSDTMLQFDLGDDIKDELEKISP